MMRRLKLTNPLAGFWARMTPRERNLIQILLLVALVMATVMLIFLRSSKLQERRDEIDALRQAVTALKTQGTVYQDRLREKQAREGQIATQPILFSTLLEEASTVTEGVRPNNQEELVPVDLGGGLRKRSVEFDLRNVTLEDLTKFLAAVEARAGHVILTHRLLIRSPSENEDRLNAEVEVATWERVEPQAGEAVE